MTGPESTDASAIDHDPVETAWSIHQAIGEWTKNVDAKASFVSAIETAVLLLVVSFTGEGRQLSDLRGCWQLSLFWAGLGLMALSLLVALSAVAPHLRGSRVAKEQAENFIYFGHLKYWEPDDLLEALRTRDVLPVLSRQIVVTSEIAWTKHRKLQFSIRVSLIAAVLLAASAFVNAKGWG